MIETKLNPLEIAKQLGESIGGELGKIAFGELELAFVNSILPRFANNQLIRMNQNLLLYWSQSYHKSTILAEFEKCLPDDVPVVGITSNSPETLFGTINDQNQIVYPLFSDVKIAIISELATFVAGRNCSEIVNMMNKVLEGERAERQLLKLSKREIAFDELQKAIEHHVLYDPEKGQLIHKPNVTIFAGSRPLDNRTYTYLVTSGYLYRHHVIQKEISDLEAKAYLKKTYHPETSLYTTLKDFNTKLKKAKIKSIDTPNDAITSDLIDTLFAVIEDHFPNKKANFSSIVDIRTKGDMYREMAAHAAIRTLTENDFKDVDKVEYTQADIDFIKDNIEHFVEAKLNPLFTLDYSKPALKCQRPINKVQALILEFLADGKEHSRKEIDTYVEPRSEACTATVSNALKKLLDKGDLDSPKFGWYRKKD
ncbi:MAG: hypothetical protein NWE93_06655 [Candidatus Bathyarchaeota archaeon]|nr:hypothetical protein [Candidatus Bathyarchaeota archaeon]